MMSRRLMGGLGAGAFDLEERERGISIILT
jgi:hypothetical protein